MMITTPDTEGLSSEIKCFLAVLALLLPSWGISKAQAILQPRKCIMVFGAHADDVDEIAGGTLAKYMDEGYEGVYVCYTNNTAGCNLERTPFFDMGPDFAELPSRATFPVGALETIQIREEEARQAAAVYGAIPIFLSFRETWFWQGRKACYIGSDEFHRYQPPGRQIVSVASRSNQEIQVVFDLLAKYQPEIVITHTLGGEKHDHGNGAYLMYLAFEKALKEKVPVGKLWMTANGWLLSDVSRENGRGVPDVHIEVGDYLDTKYEALDKHISQNGGYGREYVLKNKVQPKEVVEEFITVIDNTGSH